MSEEENKQDGNRRILTSAGFERQYEAYLADLNRKALSSENADKADRRFLRFPELRDAGNDGCDSAEVFLHGQAAKVNTRDMMLADWLRAVAYAPAGMAHHVAKIDAVKRALVEGTDSAGGYLVPQGFISDVTRDTAKISQLFQFVRKLPVKENAGRIPRVTSNVTMSWNGESDSITESQPGFGSVSYTINKMGARAILSRELVDDASPDSVELVSELFQEAIAQERDKMIAIGDGNGKPTGLYSASGVTTVNVTTLSYANIVNLKESIDMRYHGDPSMRWVCNQNVKAGLMRLVDSVGRPIFVSDVTTNWEPRLLGIPISIEKHCPDNFLFLGALKYYYWFSRSGMSVEKSTETADAFEKHEVHLKITERCDGNVVLPPTVPMVRTRVLTGVS